MPGPDSRQVRLRAFAKVNLGLRVLHKRADGYHELRTIFQTITLPDTLQVTYNPSRSTGIDLDCETAIPDNLVVRAASAVMKAGRFGGRVQIRLVKRIPIGGGLGGGSSDAAAILLALPVLAGRHLPFSLLHRLAAELGSDVPYFLLGGTALGLGRGEELYPLPEARAKHLLVAVAAVAVSTTEAYEALGSAPAGALTMTEALQENNKFQELARQLSGSVSGQGWKAFSQNDFEAVIIARHPQIKALRKKLLSCGAKPALLSGSGSAVFGVFDSGTELSAARTALQEGWNRPGTLRLETAAFLSRRGYQRTYLSALQEHTEGREWPPRSRYDR